MTTFNFLYRSSRGNVESKAITANSLTEATAIFYRTVDGRIISVS